MDPHFSSALLLILSCWLWNAECRQPYKIIKVNNGGQFGEWGRMILCPKGYAKGFAVKVHEPRGVKHDDTALNGIRLYCAGDEEIESLTAGNEVIESLTGQHGEWGELQKCPNGYLKSFALKVEEYQGAFDDTAANNIKFTCQDQKVLKGISKAKWGTYGEWSDSCDSGAICGVKAKVEVVNEKKNDYTGLNDVKFACCD